jgi:hypothetical protein
MPGALPQNRDDRRLRLRGDVTDGDDVEGVQLLCGHLPHAPQPLDLQWMQELELTAWLDEQEAVGLADCTGDLREELGARDADRDGQPDLLLDLASEPLGHLRRSAADLSQTGDVEERLVHRDPLDERGGVAEDLEDGLARLDVGVHPGRNDDGVAAQCACLRPAHGGTHSEGLRLVACREHDTAAHEDWSSPQARVVPLLDRRVERVEIGMHDHEHMFARRSDRYELSQAVTWWM